MSRLLRRVLLTIALGAAAILAAIAVPLALDVHLSRARLGAALAPLAADGRAIIAHPLAIPGACFALGLTLGWLLALEWQSGRLRQRPLLLVDRREPDMPLHDAVSHVRAHGGPALRGDRAARMLIEAAGIGRLALWQRAPSNLMRRIPPRQVRRAGLRLSLLAADTSSDSALGKAEFCLLRAEVERLWPADRPGSLIRPAKDGRIIDMARPIGSPQR